MNIVPPLSGQNILDSLDKILKNSIFYHEAIYADQMIKKVQPGEENKIFIIISKNKKETDAEAASLHWYMIISTVDLTDRTYLLDTYGRSLKTILKKSKTTLPRWSSEECTSTAVQEYGTNTCGYYLILYCWLLENNCSTTTNEKTSSSSLEEIIDKTNEQFTGIFNHEKNKLLNDVKCYFIVNKNQLLK